MHMHIDFRYIPVGLLGAAVDASVRLFARCSLAFAALFSLFSLFFSNVAVYNNLYSRIYVFTEAAYFMDLFSISHLLCHIDFFSHWEYTWICFFHYVTFNISQYSDVCLLRIFFILLDVSLSRNCVCVFFSSIYFLLLLVICPCVDSCRCSSTFQFTCCTSHHIMFLGVYLWVC